MAVVIELADRRFGQLVVIKRVENKGMQPAWLCLCDCGKTTITTGGRLRNGSTTSCGCYKQAQYDITGQRFGRLVVVRRAERAGLSKAHWICRCDCGGESKCLYL